MPMDSTSAFMPTPGDYQVQMGSGIIRWHNGPPYRLGKDPIRVQYDRHTILLFYGDPSITTDQSDPVNTWDSNFKAVYHFGDGTTLSATDSTGGNKGTLFNGPTASAGED